MSELPKNESLLSDVLGEGKLARSREQLLGETLRAVRQQRRTRRMTRIAGAAATLAAAALLVGKFYNPKPKQSHETAKTVSEGLGLYTLAPTEALPQKEIVTSVPLPAGSVAISSPFQIMVTDATEPDSVREINDQELLALAGSRPVALVRLGPGAAELVFVDELKSE